jgi:hypothetical protein
MRKSKSKSKKRSQDFQLVKQVSPNSGMPPVVKRTLHAAAFFNVPAASEYQLYLNDAFDPMGTGGTNQGYYFDQLAALYKQCFVEKTKYKLSLLGFAAAQGEHDIVAVPNVEGGSLAAQTLSELAVRPRAQLFVMPSSEYTSNYVKDPTITDTVPTKEFLEYKNWQDAEHMHSLTVDDAGLSTIYLHIINKNSAYTEIVFAEVWQDIYFFARKMVAAS